MLLKLDLGTWSLTCRLSLLPLGRQRDLLGILILAHPVASSAGPGSAKVEGAPVDVATATATASADPSSAATEEPRMEVASL